MDSYEATRIVFTKIQTLDPEHASKIMGLFLIQDHGEKEMIRLAFGPDSLLHSIIINARKELGIPSPSPSPFTSHNLFKNSASSRLINGEFTNLPSPLSITNSNFSNFQLPETRRKFSAPPFYGAAGVPDLIDELQIEDQLSFLDDGSPALGPNSGEFFYPSLPSGDGTGDLFSHRRSYSNPAPATCFPNSPKSMNFLLRQQSGSPKMPAAAAALMINYGSRQIYLTFPAESCFTEEDVSNYFSIYGPVQDVRIPYQQKRMFGFVSFVYAETVKLVLAKGNPHFVCEARVLVKPYKEKGKVPDRFRKYPQQQMDPHDPFDLQLGTRMLFNSQDLLWRKKLDEQADLEHAIELQSSRIMNLQLLDVKRNHHHHQRALSTGAAIPSPACYSPSYLNRSPVFAYDSRSSSSPDSSAIDNPNIEDGLISNLVFPVTINDDEPALKASLNVEKEKEALDFKDEYSNRKSSPCHEDDINFPKSLEYNLPDSLFTSPKKSGDHETVFSNDKNTLVYSATNNNNSITSPLTSTLDMASLKSCYFQFPRFSSDHGAIGM